MRAKDLFFEFLETIFLIACILFFFFYLFLGGYFALAQKIIATACVLSIVLLIFIIRFKIVRYQLKKIEKEPLSEEITAQLDAKDIFFDRMATLVFALLLLLPPFFNGACNGIDILQAVIYFFYIFFWRLFLFSGKDSTTKIVNLFRKDEIKDQAAIFFLPVILLLATLLDGGADVVDFFQAGIAFAGSYYRHKRIFK
jgi:hypothetical protein